MPGLPAVTADAKEITRFTEYLPKTEYLSKQEEIPMPFPLVPLLVGAAAGAFATYLLTNKLGAKKSSADQAPAEPIDAKPDATPLSD
ncbi:MAG TPA: hypothetical protein DDY14_01390 [Chromatiaceae bacterium]|jgi:hypothetical protein|nr:MAG: hypothetical protein N838_15465 [Thiohalocapsa sp. PB-PSB1]HBG93986.1 hypothetical protein [Chromatiaceae bacterium]HCS90979.1 hypothetical protein [Chromatiaceae bacterium]